MSPSTSLNGLAFVMLLFLALATLALASDHKPHRHVHLHHPVRAMNSDGHEHEESYTTHVIATPTAVSFATGAIANASASHVELEYHQSEASHEDGHVDSVAEVLGKRLPLALTSSIVVPATSTKTKKTKTKTKTKTSTAAAAATTMATTTKAAKAATSAMHSPTPTSSIIHGSATYTPSTNWIDESSVQMVSVATLAANLLTSGIKTILETGYSLYAGSGLLTVTSANSADVQPLNTVPHISRDGAHGGVVGGVKIFYFADTATYTTTTATLNGTFTGFTSNSIAVDVGNNAYNGKAITLQDPVGAFGQSNGAMRGAVPNTVGEASYNNNGDGRIAIWPCSSLVPLTNKSSLMYAQIMYINYDLSPAYQLVGNTLATVSVTSDGQPSIQRTTNLMFPNTGLDYGGFAGIRSWGPSGVGGSDGKIYLLGGQPNNMGLWLARVTASKSSAVANYEYLDYSTLTWSSTPGSASNTAAALFPTTNSYSSGDVIYSPRHGTFIFVYQNGYTDSKFWYSVLLADHFIAPSYTAATYTDICENLYKYKWSTPVVLLEMPVQSAGLYTYDGGIYQGYFGSNDITNGGTRMLLGWTSPTGGEPNTVENNLQLWTAEVAWN